MITIQELLNRINWDKEFAKGEFVIGYYDRVEKRVLKVPLRDIYFKSWPHLFEKPGGMR